MTTVPDAQTGIRYLDMQAYVGITKHIGGRAATDELLALSHIENAHEVLNVGCGIGISSTYIAKKHGCRVVGVDISEKMIEWSRRRAHREQVEDKVEFQVADILDLPFEADRFDAVIVESVIAFVVDKAQAIRECRRVAWPGGYVAVNESMNRSLQRRQRLRLARWCAANWGRHSVSPDVADAMGSIRLTGSRGKTPPD